MTSYQSKKAAARDKLTPTEKDSPAYGPCWAGWQANKPEQEQDFCPRCGKRTKDIHTCTPPQQAWIATSQNSTTTGTDMKEHPYADFLRALADGVPLDDFEFRYSSTVTFSSGNLDVLDMFVLLSGKNSELIVTRKTPTHKTHQVNGFEVPAPETELLKIGQEYWLPCFSAKDWAGEPYEWDGGSVDQGVLKRGLVHLTKEAAIANAKAMVGIDPATEGGEV